MDRHNPHLAVRRRSLVEASLLEVGVRDGHLVLFDQPGVGVHRMLQRHRLVVAVQGWACRKIQSWVSKSQAQRYCPRTTTHSPAGSTLVAVKRSSATAKL